MVNYRATAGANFGSHVRKKNFLWQELKRLRRKQLQGQKIPRRRKKKRSMEDSRRERVLKSGEWMDGSQVSPEQ